MMKRTVFSTPFITPCFRACANLWLKLSGWKVIAEDLPPPPYVIIAVPHTSNWDFMLMLACIFHLKLNVNWMGKHTLFPPLVAFISKWFGGIPINRSKAHSVVSQTVNKFKEHPTLAILIPPEGTRKKAPRWKTGFYHIAHQAGVPILMAAIDAKQKEMRFVGSFQPTGDINNDLPEIQRLLSGFEGIIPENAWDSPD